MYCVVGPVSAVVAVEVVVSGEVRDAAEDGAAEASAVGESESVYVGCAD